MAALFSLGEDDNTLAQFGRMDQAATAWFKELGLYSLRENYALLNLKPEPPYATNACTVV
jgi:hypothetical protein